MKSISKFRFRLNKKCLIVFLSLIFLYTVLGFLVLPTMGKWWINEKLPEKLGRAIRVETVQLNPYVLSVRVRGLTLADDRGETLVDIGDCYVNLQLFPTLFGKITIKSFVLADSTGTVILHKEDVFNFANLATSTSEKDPESEKPVTEASEVEIPKVRVMRLQLKNLSLNFSDHTLKNPFERSYHLNDLLVEDLATYPMAEAPLSMIARIGDESQLTLEAAIASLYPLDIKLKTGLSKFELSHFQPYLLEYIEAEVSGMLDASFDSQILYQNGNFSCLLQGDDFVFLSDLQLRDLTHQQEMVRVDTIKIHGTNLNTMEGGLSLSLEIDGPKVTILRQADGTVAIPRILSDENMHPDPMDEGAEEEAGSIQFLATLDQLRISNGSILFQDEALKNPVQTGIKNLDVTVENVVHSMNTKTFEDRSSFDLAFEMLNGGQVHVEGESEFPAFRSTVTTRIDSLMLPQFQAYLSEFTKGKLGNGILDGAFSIVMDSMDTPPHLSGSVTVGELAFYDGETDTLCAGLKSISISDISFDGQQGEIGSIEIVEPAGRFFIDKNGRNTGDRLFYSDETPTDEQIPVSDPVPEAETQTAGIIVELHELQISDGNFEFVDLSVDPAFSTRLSKLKVTGRELTNSGKVTSRVELSARINEAAELSGSGEMNLLFPRDFVNMDLDLTALDVSAATSYSERYIGRKINRGQLSLDSSISVQEGKLDGRNLLTLKSFTLGDKVDSPDALNLPVGLAVAVLQDADGVIKQTIPIHGDLTQPGVPVSQIALNAFMTALRNVIVKSATAPFKLLGGMVGGGENVDILVFEAGETRITSEHLAKLDSLVEILSLRPGLKVNVESQFDKTSENLRLRKQLLYLALETYKGGGFSLPEIIDPAEQLSPTNVTEELLLDRLSQAISRGLPMFEVTEADSKTAPMDQSTEKGDQVPAKTVSIEEKDDRNILSKTLGKVAGLFGKKEAEGQSGKGEEAAANSPEVAADLPASATYEATVDDLAKAMALVPSDAIEEAWIRQIAVERLNAVSNYLLDSKGISPERLFFNRTATAADSSSIQFELTD